MVTLVLTEKGGDTKQLSFDKDEVTIGRVQGNDLVLPKGNVSKRHCRIMVQGSRFSVEDLKSTNGTYINGRKIGEPTAISGADKIYVGDFVLKVENAEADGAHASLPEAGALSTALPRRPPPPPAPGRATATMRAMDEEALAEIQARANARSNLPPPPVARRESPLSLPSLAEPPIEEAEMAPPPPSEVDLDEEALSPRPRLPVPPLKSPRPLLVDHENQENRDNRDNHAGGQLAEEELRPAAHQRVPTPKRPTASPVPSSPEGLASWLREQLAADGTSAIYLTGNHLGDRAQRKPGAHRAAGGSVDRGCCARARIGR